MRTIVASWLLIAALDGTAPALADATADGRAVSEAFEKAVAAGDLQAVLALYRDDASVIWPGQGEEGKGKAAIEKLARGFLADMKGARLILKSQTSIPLGEGYIVNLGNWEQTSTSPAGKPTSVEIRTSEVLAKADGKWLYLIDHASIGLPPPKAAPKPRRARRER
jgi:uncharacterized protein (TIGR02246 family)